MRTIKVKRTELLERIEANRKKHIAEYTEACEGYRVKMHQLIAEKIAELTKFDQALTANGGTPDGPHINTRLTMPKSYEQDYDQVIEMLKMSVDDELTIQSDEFACYVMDRWAWKENHSQTMDFYGKGR